jgi:hemophore-related protein
MARTSTTGSRGLVGVFASTALCGAFAGIVAMPTAAAQPAPCTAAGLANTLSGVTAAAGQYLDAHPDANDAITGAGSESPEQAQASLRAYFAGHPQEYADLRGIAQPLVDLRNSCPQNVSGAQLAALLQAFTSP